MNYFQKGWYRGSKAFVPVLYTETKAIFDFFEK